MLVGLSGYCSARLNVLSGCVVLCGLVLGWTRESTNNFVRDILRPTLRSVGSFVRTVFDSINMLWHDLGEKAKRHEGKANLEQEPLNKNIDESRPRV